MGYIVLSCSNMLGLVRVLLMKWWKKCWKLSLVCNKTNIFYEGTCKGILYCLVLKCWDQQGYYWWNDEENVENSHWFAIKLDQAIKPY